MNDNDHTAHQPDESDQIPGQVLGEYLELIDADVDERITDAVVEERLQQFLLQVAPDEVSGSPTAETPATEGQADTLAEGGSANIASPIFGGLVDVLLQPQHGTPAALESARAAWVSTARLEAESILEAARRQAEQYQDAALQQAATTVRGAREEADRILAEAQEEASQITNAARAQASLTTDATAPLSTTAVTTHEVTSIRRLCDELRKEFAVSDTARARPLLLITPNQGQGDRFPSGSLRKMTLVYNIDELDLDVVPALSTGLKWAQTCPATWHWRRALTDPARYVNGEETFDEQGVLSGLAILCDEIAGQEMTHRRLARLRCGIIKAEREPQEAVRLDAITQQLAEDPPGLGRSQALWSLAARMGYRMWKGNTDAPSNTAQEVPNYDMLLSLARRTQALVHRQLSMLDTMERKRDIDPKDLEELFRLDHLATRMRRNAENLIVLSGSIPARGWRQPVPMVDVVRAAVGEVEDYTRVTVMPFGPVELAGRAVGDVTHLLAELIENAVSFSPPDTAVHVGGHLVANGFAIDIEDRGLGMTDEKLAEINERIVNPPEFNLRSNVQLGLFVVAKLAKQYGLRVSLKRSTNGGTTAVVIIPRDLIVERGSTLVAASTTPEGGLEVRRPGTVSATTPARRSTTTILPLTGPALVAVPPPTPGAFTTRAPTGNAPALKPEVLMAEPRAPQDNVTSGSDTCEPQDQPPVTDISATPSGLPVRVPQANLAEALRTDEPAVADEPDGADDPGCSQEEIQRITGSYQRGILLSSPCHIHDPR
ncbi:ATP-binding protein [Actinomadura geliboluensis]|uniref:ATP-binding protein n=1 Tax=Actinomadura geliboluensis TaxID=882440 RepID=UPI003680FD83